MKLAANKHQIALLIMVLIVVVGLLSLKGRRRLKPVNIENIKLEFAADSIDPEKLWRSYFEDKLEENKNITTDQISEIKKIFKEDAENIRLENKGNIEDLKSDFVASQNALKSKIDEIIELQNKETSTLPYEMADPNISVHDFANENGILASPKDSADFIPETSFVTGILIGGLAVSTSIGSKSAPIPVVIRLLESGNLSKDFSINIKNCRILGSAYGDLSSERAIIRAESLVCTKKQAIITTKIAGIIYGDDGMNGIRGRIVDMSSKHIKNATFGSMLSAFGSSMKTESSLAISPFGALGGDKINGLDKLKNNSLTGAGNAAEKIAQYYIKKAENMSPILQIPGGTKVDVLFTKGVHLGSSDIVERIVQEKK